MTPHVQTQVKSGTGELHESQAQPGLSWCKRGRPHGAMVRAWFLAVKDRFRATLCTYVFIASGRMAVSACAYAQRWVSFPSFAARLPNEQAIDQSTMRPCDKQSAAMSGELAVYKPVTLSRRGHTSVTYKARSKPAQPPCPNLPLFTRRDRCRLCQVEGAVASDQTLRCPEWTASDAASRWMHM